MTLRTLTFGDLDTGIWGALWDLGEGQPRYALLGAGAAHESPAAITGSEQAEAWTVSGPDVQVQCEAVGEPGALSRGFDQLVRVRGRLGVDDSEHEVDCLGCRGRRDSIDPARFEAVRDVSCWFEPDVGFALVAARPKGATTHAEDMVSASAFEEGHSLQIADPRLSTTYTAGGQPTRASLELWLEPQEADAAEIDDGGRQQDGGPSEPFPRRAAGEAVGAGGTVADGRASIQAELFRWHARGREGAGVYVLARLGQG